MLPRLKKLLCDGNSAIQDVVALVRLDPGISARVLQVGNSAYYSQGLRCYTVDEAVGRVGYDQIYELVANAVASQVLVRPLACYAIEADALWESSIACAVAAEILAERFNIDRDIAYTVGLLHGVGLVVIDEWVTRTNPGVSFVSRSLPFETCEEERNVLGFHNAEAGATLLRQWEFPSVISEALRWQYLPRGTAAHAQLATLLHLAKWIRTCARASDGLQPAMVDPVLLRTAKMTPGQLPKIAGDVRLRLKSIGSLLEDFQRKNCGLAFPNGRRVISDIRNA